METFYVVKDNHGDTFAATTLLGAIELANLDPADTIVDGWTVYCRDAGEARVAPVGMRQQSKLDPMPKPHVVWLLDVWGSDGDWTVNDRRRLANMVWIGDGIDDDDIIKQLRAHGYMTKVAELEVEDHGCGILHVNDADTGEPLLMLESEAE